ncbi:MAG: PilZ domain-containing protein [Candidatus Omnitrophica bacterium]|nr:PilZ domain-containing protein [Candidatus Omnitrophota bacterium]
MENTSYPGPERRKFSRLRLRLAVVYQVNKPLTLRMQVGDKEILATALDLSEGGMAISSKIDIPNETDLLIKFTLFKVDNTGHVSFYGPMEIIGQVRYNTVVEDGVHRLGINFIKIDEKDQKEIVNFIKMTQ